MATLKNIYYHIANKTFTVEDQFEGESDVTLLTIDFTGSGVDDWTKWVDFRLYDGTGIPTSLGLGNLHTYTMPISLMRRGRLEIQPYAISGTNEVTKFAIKQVVINRSLSVVQDDVAYDPSIIADIQADLAHLDGTKMETDGSNSDVVELSFRNGGTLVYDLNRQVMRIIATDGTELNIGGETWYEEGKATEDIANGAPVQFAGAFGDNYLVKNAVASEINADPSLFMGLSTKETLADEWVKITHFGLVHDFNTNGWAMGTILWFDSINGGLTATKPSIPNAQIEVCAVVKTSETVGSVLVRPHFLQDCYTQAEVDALLSEKQPNLVSGVNIKTVNGMNIVGSGNVVIPVVDGIDGQDGVDGLSAYEVAVANGFIGTEAEWLLSLNGADGLDGADAVAGKLPSQYDELPAPVGTVSAVLEDVPGVSITIHLDEPVELAMMASMELQTQSGSSASTIEVAFNIDGVDHDPLQRLLSGSNDLGIGALVHRTDEVPAGDHIVKLRFRRVSGTSTPGINKAHMLVMGMQGAKGIDGDDGVGVVAGGTTNQVLAKLSATNYDTYWMDVYNKSEADTLLLAKADKVVGKSLVLDTVISDLTDGGDSVLHYHLADRVDISNKVDKVAGKSLVSDTLITDLSDGGDSVAHKHDTMYYTEAEVNSLLSGKQPTLVSGTNIKTINGATVLGSGDLTVSGEVSLESGADKIIFGQEYASHFHKKVMTSDTTSGMDALLATKLKVVFSGDSTTAGDGTTTGFKLNELMKTLTQNSGFPYITTVNQGHSGATTATWDSTYVATDIALAPDVYVVRWGLNDATLGVSAFEASLRSGLTKVRASLALANCTVVLMTPNSTNDTPNLRDATWHKAINGVIRQVARDFQCVFIDTYQLLSDSINAGDWMDDPYADGRHIHPLNVMNVWITDAIFNVLFPESIRVKYSTSGVANFNSTDVVKSASDLPFTYPYGLSMYRCTDGSRDGALITFRSSDSIFYQINMGYNSSTGVMSYRFAYTATNAWTPWFNATGITSPTENTLTLNNSWTAYNVTTHEAPVYYIDGDGYINIRGLIKGGTMTPGTTFATLPTGFRPTLSVFRGTICSGGFASFAVNPDGTCVINSCPANAWFSIGVEKFK